MPRCWIIVPIQTLPRFVSRGGFGDNPLILGDKIPFIFREGENTPVTNMATRWGTYIGNKWSYKTITTIIWNHHLGGFVTPLIAVISPRLTIYFRPFIRVTTPLTYSWYLVWPSSIFPSNSLGVLQKTFDSSYALLHDANKNTSLVNSVAMTNTTQYVVYI